MARVKIKTSDGDISKVGKLSCRIFVTDAVMLSPDNEVDSQLLEQHSTLIQDISHDLGDAFSSEPILLSKVRPNA